MANSKQQMWQSCHDGSRKKPRSVSSAPASASGCLAPLWKDVPFPQQWLSTPQPPESYFAGHCVGGAHRNSGFPGEFHQAALNSMSFEDWMIPFVQQGKHQGFQEDTKSRAGENNQIPQAVYQTPLANTETQVAHGLPVTTTTLLIRHIPRKVMQEEALRVWSIDEYNYDLFYLSFDLKKRRGTGRIHINFLTHADAMNFYTRWNGRAWPSRGTFDDGKRLFIEPARRQGFHSNSDHWDAKLQRTAGAAFLPAVFYFGQRHPF